MKSLLLWLKLNKKYDICQWSVQKNGLAIYYMYLNIPYGTENTYKIHGSLLIQIASLVLLFRSTYTRLLPEINKLK